MVSAAKKTKIWSLMKRDSSAFPVQRFKKKQKCMKKHWVWYRHVHGRFLPREGGTVDPVGGDDDDDDVVGEPEKCCARLASEPEFERCTRNSQQHSAFTR